MSLNFVFAWITGLVQPATVVAMTAAGYSLDESLAASSVIAAIAVEVALKLRDNDDNGNGGKPMLAPA